MLSEHWRYLFLFYFVTHVPATLLIDGQILLGHLYPQILKNILDYHINVNGDFLVAHPPLWFKSLIFVELLFQLPFFFVAVYCFYARKNWIRLPAIVYGVQCASSLVPILTEIIFVETMEFRKKAALLAMYFPYFVIPILLTAVMLQNSTLFLAKLKKF